MKFDRFIMPDIEHKDHFFVGDYKSSFRDNSTGVADDFNIEILVLTRYGTRTTLQCAQGCLNTEFQLFATDSACGP